MLVCTFLEQYFRQTGIGELVVRVSVALTHILVTKETSHTLCLHLYIQVSEDFCYRDAHRFTLYKGLRLRLECRLETLA